MSIAQQIETTLYDRTNMRLALEERIISLLKLFRSWEPEVMTTLNTYYKLGGYFSMKDFEEFSRVKIKKAYYDD